MAIRGSRAPCPGCFTPSPFEPSTPRVSVYSIHARAGQRHVFMNLHIHINIYIYIYICGEISACMHIDIYICICIYIYVYVYIYIKAALVHVMTAVAARVDFFSDCFYTHSENTQRKAQLVLVHKRGLHLTSNAGWQKKWAAW